MNFKEAIAVQQSFGLQKNSEFRRLFNHQLLKARNTGVTISETVLNTITCYRMQSIPDKWIPRTFDEMWA